MVSAALVASLLPLLAHCMPDLDELRSGGGCPDDTNPACAPAIEDDGASGAAGDIGELPEEASTDDPEPDGGQEAEPPADDARDASGGMADVSIERDASVVDGPAPDVDERTAEAGPDGGLSDASDASDSGDAGDAGCALSVPGTVLCSFADSTLNCGGFPGSRWQPFEEFGPVGDAQRPPPSSVTWSETEGHACAGALALTVPFTAYTSPDRVMVLTDFKQNWTGKTKLHAWAKVVIPPSGSIAHLAGVQLSVSSANYSAFRGFYVNAPIFADGQWHEFVGSLTPAPLSQPTPFVPADVVQVGVQLAAQNAPPPGGPPEPLTTTVYVDDIWLE
jgi:hypothetical protein